MAENSLLKKFEYQRRIYHRNTDSAGVVYYADYLVFFEEARAEWLRSYNFSQADIVNDFKTLILVKKIHEMNFIKPAIMDDLLVIECTLLTYSNVSFTIEQIARNLNGDSLVSAKIDLLSVDSTSMRPKRTPTTLLESLSQG